MTRGNGTVRSGRSASSPRHPRGMATPWLTTRYVAAQSYLAVTIADPACSGIPGNGTGTIGRKRTTSDPAAAAVMPWPLVRHRLGQPHLKSYCSAAKMAPRPWPTPGHGTAKTGLNCRMAGRRREPVTLWPSIQTGVWSCCLAGHRRRSHQDRRC